ncbi:unnamed protein product [Echinostoma caproni]|uniref:Protein S-acyltransferase n=1 Tax=Echinostoma caproni TaxID=27848 RepID=A0A183BB14_9TREM|nr:unnamed protein product [Echinostoma caproni]
MCTTYVAIVLWLVFLAFLVIPTLCWIMFNSICTMELAHVWHGPGARRPGPDGRVAPSLEELRLRNELSPVDDTYTARLAYYYPELVRSMGYLPMANGGRVIAPGEPRPPLPGYPPFGAPPGSRYTGRFYDPEFNYVFNLTNYGKSLLDSLICIAFPPNPGTFSSVCATIDHALSGAGFGYCLLAAYSGKRLE